MLRQQDPQRAPADRRRLRGQHQRQPAAVDGVLDGALGRIGDEARHEAGRADGQPYIQHRGGAAGFLRVIDERTLGFADFRGNRQYVSIGNLSENPKADLFLIDCARRQRIKIWGTARVVEDDPALIARLRPEGYAGTPEQAILFEIAAWDANCPQHIPQLIAAKDVAAVLADRDWRILVLEAELARARAMA